VKARAFALAALACACACAGAEPCEPIPEYVEMGPRQDWHASCPDFTTEPECGSWYVGQDYDNADCSAEGMAWCSGGVTSTARFEWIDDQTIRLSVELRRIDDGCRITYWQVGR
jgi:hypothetical protein